MVAGKRAHLRVELVPVHDGHHQVEQDHVGLPREPAQRIVAVARACDFIALLAEEDRVEITQVGDVFYDEHSLRWRASFDLRMMDLHAQDG